MSDADEFDDVDGDGSGGSASKALRQQNSKLAKEKADLEAQVRKLLEKDRARTIADVLGSKGANPKLAKYVVRDLGDSEVTEESVATWLAEEGELFGYKPSDAEDEVDEVTENQQRIHAASASGKPPATSWTPEKIKDLPLAEFAQKFL